MRNTLALSLVLAACDTREEGRHRGLPLEEGSFLAWRADVQMSELNGFALPEGQSYAAMGIGGNTCTLDIESGEMAFDMDGGHGDDTVLDSVVIGGAATLLVGLADGWGISLVDIDAYTADEWSPGDDVVTGATLDDDGNVVVVVDSGDGCAVNWLGSSLGARSEHVAGLPDAWCGDSAVAVDSVTQAVFVTGPRGVAVVLPTGEVAIADVPGNRIAWDARRGYAFVAEVDGTTLSAVRPDAQVAWTVDLGGALASFAAADGSVIATLSGADARVVMLDGASGELEAEAGLNGRVVRVKASADGRTVALLESSGYHVFDNTLK